MRSSEVSIDITDEKDEGKRIMSKIFARICSYLFVIFLVQLIVKFIRSHLFLFHLAYRCPIFDHNQDCAGIVVEMEDLVTDTEITCLNVVFIGCVCANYVEHLEPKFNEITIKQI